jgi:tetratricopeptide (TPR) repeat protein
MALSIAQRTLRDFLQETKDAMNSGRIEGALANCQTILASFPESLEAQRLLGEVYLAQGRLEDALHAFDWVLTNDPENVIVYCNRATVSERMSDVDTALDCYQQAYELSRGNGQIRQEFTQLSTRVGQQGFVFSRAGLARLYMRGDLLPQAIQEWEAVLAVTPERLDARTGLLEAYWRNGTFDRVEELATCILQEVPNCLKALLLLAHVTAPKDMTYAQTLLRQAEALDPDLVMAQELFADMFAHYPDDPFLKLLKKAPCVLNISPTPNIPPQATSAPPVAPSLSNGQLPMTRTEASDSLPAAPARWESSQSWSNNAAFMPPFPDGQFQQNNNFPWSINQATTGSDDSKGDMRQAAASGLHSSDSAMKLSSDVMPMTDSWPMQEASSSSASPEEPQLEPWEMLQQALHTLPIASPEEPQLEPWEMLQQALHTLPTTSPEEPQPELWEMLQQALHTTTSQDQEQEQDESQYLEGQSAIANTVSDKPSWESQNRDIFAEPQLGSNDSWISPSDSHGTEVSDWTTGTQKNNPPSWLSMLTQMDHKEITPAIPPLEDPSSAPIEPEKAPVSSPLEQVSDQLATSLVFSQSTSLISDSDDDDDDSGFGPAWLKSLGATILEEEDSQLEQPATSVSPLFTAPEQLGKPAFPVSPLATAPEQLNQPAFPVSPLATAPEQLNQPAFPVSPLATAPEQLNQPAFPSSPLATAPEQMNQPAFPSSPLATAPEQLNQPAFPVSPLATAPEQLNQPAFPVSPLATTFDQLEKSAAFAASDASEAEPHEQPVMSDPWTASESGIQSATHKPWWTSMSEAQKTPVVEPELQVQQAVFESHKAFSAKPQPESVSSPSAKAEQDFITTLEDLEQNLYAKGFVAMEPNSLAAIAQAEEAKSTDAVTPLPAQRISQPQQGTSQKQPLLPELGKPFHEKTTGLQPPPTSAALWSSNTADLPAEPLWLQTLRSASASEPNEATIDPRSSMPIIPRPVPPTNVSQPSSNIPQVQIKTVSDPTFDPTTAPSADSKQRKAPSDQSPHANPFLETELETTMKRPAVRLQSMPHSVAPHDTAKTTGKARISEQREPATNKTNESGANYKDRLVEGYQHQLVGNYDEAMQDYRLVIRGAPELLDEVISNLRALLKLAPKYSVGYRVLGDAYMRRGEYLQAMESYNSALTMAKKAKN